ncbi:UvrD-helicase domain-containing protein [Algoriphagus namhaensis]|uniref:DNA 3'-5' helicase n=1 Tax=Algoriphagus namhaensis TaxID=915353 RepID=A0ABV8AUZ2_9BACT
MEQKPFIIYKSSAGSGKTYTLTLEYLKLALRSSHTFKQILAVTFTNKATQEMKERILEVLARLSREIRPEEFLDEQLMIALNCDADELQKRSRETLLDILHGYGYFAVSTIDSFFQRVIRSFAREMDLQAKFELELDQSAVLERLVDRIVEKVAEDKSLLNWLVAYAEEQIEDGKSWDIRNGIKGLGTEIFQEKFKVHQALFNQTIGKEGFLADFRKKVQLDRALILQEAEAIKKEAEEIRLRFGLEWIDFKGGNNSFAKRFGQVGTDSNKPIPALTEPMKQNLPDAQNWFTKTSIHAAAIEQAANEGLIALIFKLPPLLTRWNTIQALSKNLNAFGVFSNLLNELRDLKEEEGILLISDVNDFLKGITSDNEAPFIYEKIGNQYQHFLIDEFQDTSEFQWSSFKPLLVNSLGSMNTNLIVGDVKQSIYRWRGGRLELLLNEVQEQIQEAYHQVKKLETNFRSLPKVIDFNNALFGVFPELMQGAMETEYSTDSENLLGDAYEDVAQQVPKKKRLLDFKGRIRLEFKQKESRTSYAAEEEDEEESDDTVLDKLPGLVMQLQDQGYALRDIAFLVRKNDQGADIADKLMSYGQDHPESNYRFDVLSEDSLFVSKSAAVKAVVALLQYLANPADNVPLKTFWYYYSLIHGISYSHELFEKNSLPSELKVKQIELNKNLKTWLQMPLMELIEEILSFSDLLDAEIDLAYVSGIKEAAFDFVKKNRADLQGFLDWWELNHQKRTVKIPEDHDAMRILTIHKAKGLQFKVVIMPYLDWQMVADKTQAPILWSEYDVSEQLKTVLPLTHTSILQDSAFQDLYQKEVRLAYLDSLNMLYVAFTRAEEQIFGFADFTQTKAGKVSLKRTGNLLYQLFSTGFTSIELESKKYWDQEALVFDWGETSNLKSARVTQNNLAMAIRWESVAWSGKLKTREYAWDFSENGVSARAQRKLGLLVHEILEEAKTGEHAMNLLQQMTFEGRLDEETAVQVKTQLENLFLTPEFVQWYQSDFQVMAEQGILLPGGKQKRPDRILIGPNEALVIDFKTGEKKDVHQKQVKEYMDLTRNLTQLPVKGYVCYLDPTEIISVHE